MLNVSWYRAYHSRNAGRVPELMEILARAGMLMQCDMGAHESLLDIQAVRSKFFALTKGPEFSVAGNWAAFDSRAQLGEMRGTSHVTLHESGFIVIRLTITGVATADGLPITSASVAALEQLLWKPTQELTWNVAGHAVKGNLRHCFNLLFLLIHETLKGRSTVIPDLSTLAFEGPAGCDHLHDLARRGEVGYPFPVSLGAHFEVVSRAVAADPEAAREIIAAVAGSSQIAAPVSPPGNFGNGPAAHWYVGEVQSFLFLEEGVPGESMMVDSRRARLLEFMCLRRGVLRSLQRDTQRVIIDSSSISRRRIEEWHFLLSSTTDDYVLNDRAGRILGQLVGHYETTGDVRGLHELEEQVRRNIESFRARLDWSSQSLSTVIGAIFAAVAAVVGLSSLARVVAALAIGGAAPTLPEDHPVISALIDTALTLGAFVVTWYLVRRSARRVSLRRPS